MGKRKAVEKKVPEEPLSAEESENDATNHDDNAGPDLDMDVDDPMTLDEMKKGHGKTRKLSKKEITLMSDEEIKNKYR